MLRPFLISVFILALFASLQAQIRDNSHWDFRLHKTELFNYAKKYPVSKIQRKLPKIGFGMWLQKIVGAKTKINWDIVDCGVKDPLPETEKGYDLTMCIETTAKITKVISVRIAIEYGTFDVGVSRNMPIVRGIFIGDMTNGNGVNLTYLRDMSEELSSIKGRLVYFDPYLGVFNISGEKPPGFENFSAMWVDTTDFDSKGNVIPIKKHGILEDNQISYRMRNIFYDGKTWSFETATVGGISYTFVGKFGELKLDRNGSQNGDKILHGHLVKFLNGKQIAEAEITFDFNVEGE